MKRNWLINLCFIGLAAACMMLLGACASVGVKKAAKTQAEKSAPANVPRILALEAKRVKNIGTRVIVSCNAPVKYTAFKLAEPTRVVLDLMAQAEQGLLAGTEYSDTRVQKILIETPLKDKPLTRITIYAKGDVDYHVRTQGSKLLADISPLKSTKQAQPETGVKQKETSTASQRAKPETPKPRIFFEPKPGRGNEVLGIDYVLLDHGKSRLIITTKSEARYNVKTQGSKGIQVRLMGCSIPPLLKRHLDALYFSGAVKMVKALHDPHKHEVVVEVMLKEMVPFHVSRKKDAVLIDFEAPRVSPPELHLSPNKTAASARATGATRLIVQPGRSHASTTMDETGSSRYSHHKISVTFREETLQNILYFFSRTLDLNMIWDPKDIGDKRISVDLKDIPWDQAIDITLRAAGLTYRIDGDVWYVTSLKRAQDMEKERSQTRLQLLQLKQVEKGYEPKITAYIKVKYRKAGDLIELIDILLSQGNRISKTSTKESSNANGATVENEQKTVSMGPERMGYSLAELSSTNTIVVYGSKDVVKKIRNLVAKLDIPQTQVMIEARIVEATTSFSQELGLSWTGKYTTRHNPWGGTAFGQYSYNFSTNFAPAAATQGGVNFINAVGTKLLNAQIALGEAENELKTLSAPKVVALNGETAKIDQGTQVFEPSGLDQNGNMTYEAVDATLTLEVTPTILAGDMVNLDLHVQENEPDYANARGENIPIKKKHIETSLSVRSGETVVIGGIYKEDKNLREEGTPLLRDIPLLGWLFKKRSKGKNRTELLIFITPTVIKAASTAYYE